MTTSLRKFATPEIIFGNGCRHLVAKYAENLSLTHCFLVTDPGVRQAGWVDPVITALAERGIAATVFDSISPNPRDKQVRQGAARYLEAGCDGIIAIGGGSPMDAAKGMGFMVTNGRDVLDFEGVDRVDIPGPPMICVPTTAGTSADISQFCIITDTNRHIKIAIVAQAAIPDVALVDPETTYTMDAELTAATGLDALTHAFEAYASTVSSPTTDLVALDAVRRVRANLLTAIQDPQNQHARTEMMLASMHAGLAFSNAILGAVHAMAHSLGGTLDSPHGDCNAILLPHVVDFNFSAAPDRYRDLAAAFGIAVINRSDDEVHSALVEQLFAFGTEADAMQGLRSMGMSREDIPRLAKTALADACMMTNPRKMSLEDVEKLYEAAW